MDDHARMQELINKLVVEVSDLRRRADGDDFTYADTVAGALALHLQLPPMETAERKRVLSKYKDGGLPKVLKDENGLAAKTVSDNAERKYLLTEIPRWQRDALDVAKVLAHAWHEAGHVQDTAHRSELLVAAVRDALLVAVDNAQRMARDQLRGVFKAAGAEGALSFFRPDSEDVDHTRFDFKDSNVLQHEHVEAIAAYKKMANSVSNNNNGRRNQGNGGRRSGGKGGGRGKGSWSGQGGRGRGSGWGGGSAWSYRRNNNYNNNNNNNNNSNNRAASSSDNGP
jgi:hypothetical protein